MTPEKAWERTQARWPRPHVYWLSRSIICFVIAVSMGTLFLQPANLFLYALDVLLRSYLIFVGTVMSHEGTHGHLGRTKYANLWWGRLALVPSLVPYTNFRRTHRLHHAYTNIPDKDPDHFMNARHVLELPLRAVAMPHQWFFWLWKRGRIRWEDLAELALNYAGILAIWLVMFGFIGAARLFWGVAPALIAVSLMLWYPFAFKTHEGFSTGSAEERSHNYYGRFMYWFSLGLSVHRVHHMHPQLTWIELKGYVEQAPGSANWRLLPGRDIQPDSLRT